MSYPCATTPSCGRGHKIKLYPMAVPELWLRTKCHDDHADAYIALIAKIRDRKAMGHFLWHLGGGKNERADALLAYLLPEQAT